MKLNGQKDSKSRPIKGSGVEKGLVLKGKVNGNVRNCTTKWAQGDRSEKLRIQKSKEDCPK